MADGWATQIVALGVPPMLGLIIWFMNRMISDNDRAHSSFTKTINSLKNDIHELENRLIKLDVLQPKELKDLEKMVLHQKSKMDEIAQKVKRHGEPGMKTSDDGERSINYGHFPDDGRKVVQVLDVPASVNAKNSAFKIEIIERVERTETQLKTHEMAIGRIAQLSKDTATKSSGIIVAVKEIQAAVAPDIAVHRAKKGVKP